MGDLGPPSANGGSVRASALLRKYGWPGLNRHGLRNRQALDLVRLPIPPHPREILPIAGVRFGVCLPPSPAQPCPIKGPFCARSRWWTTALARRRLCPPPRHRQRYSPSRHLASTTCDQGNWCRGPDSDRHALNAHEFLRLACLPIPSPRQNENWSPRPCSGRRPPVYKTGALPLSYAGGKVEPSLEIGLSCSPYQGAASPAMLRRQKCCCRPALRRAACRPQTGEGDPMQRTPPGSCQRTEASLRRNGGA